MPIGHKKDAGHHYTNANLKNQMILKYNLNQLIKQAPNLKFFPVPYQQKTNCPEK